MTSISTAQVVLATVTLGCEAASLTLGIVGAAPLPDGLSLEEARRRRDMVDAAALFGRTLLDVTTSTNRSNTP